MSDFSLEALLDSRRGEDLDLWARTDQPTVRAGLEDDRLRPDVGTRRGRVPLRHRRDALPRPARRLRDVRRRPEQSPGSRGARRGARARDAGDARARDDAAPGLLAEALVGLAGGRIERCLFTSSGSESVESAIKLGRTATGRTRVLSADHGFHGLTLGATSVNGNEEFRARFQPLLPGCEQVPFGDLEALEAELRREDVALFLVEPVQGKGINLPPDGYLAGAQELCRRHGTLFGVDEVMTGLGRTGRTFAFQHWGLEPDLVTLAKTLSGGYVPSGALLMSRSVHEAVFDSMSHAMSHGSTFAPNELAMAAGLATLHELREQRLVEQSARLGERLLELTRPLVDEFEVVRDVRGLGLAWAIEFGEPEGGGRRTYRMIEKAQRGLFAQLVIVPLFTEHHILTQVAGPRDGGDPDLAAARRDRCRRRGFAEALRVTIKARARAEVADEARAHGRGRRRSRDVSRARAEGHASTHLASTSR
jgi:acetylornithine/succinyldiaminopimelate/putrescine aminotransferase